MPAGCLKEGSFDSCGQNTVKTADRGFRTTKGTETSTESGPGSVGLIGTRGISVLWASGPTDDTTLYGKERGPLGIGRSRVGGQGPLSRRLIWVDARDDLATSYLRTLDGLCFYEEPPERGCATATGAGSPAKEPRSIERDTTATVVPVPERATANYRSALEKARGVIMAGHLMIHEANCPKLVYALRQPLEELLRSPVMKGLVWVMTALEDAKRSADTEAST